MKKRFFLKFDHALRIQTLNDMDCPDEQPFLTPIVVDTSTVILVKQPDKQTPPSKRIISEGPRSTDTLGIERNLYL